MEDKLIKEKKTAEQKPETKEADKKPRQRRPMDYAQRFLITALAVVIVIWLMVSVVFGFMVAPNGDMYPRIDSGDLLLFYRFDKNVHSQDVVVLDKNDTRYVGRVIAIEGDTVDITDDERLIINGNTVSEPNIFYSTSRYEGFVNYPLTLGKDECFVLVDSREKGEDSRYYGVVKTDEIRGTVITVVRRTNL